MIENPSILTHQSIDDSINDFIGTPLDELDEDIYQTAIDIFLLTDGWMKEYRDSFSELVQKLTLFESTNDVVRKKTSSVFSKIISTFSPETSKRDLDYDFLKRIANYRYGDGDFSLAESINDFFIAKKLGLQDLQFEILTFLLSKDPEEFEEFEVTGEKNEQALISLLAECRAKSVCVKADWHLTRVICLEDSSSPEAWACLEKLNAYTPCQRLDLKGIIDRNLFSSFIQSNSLVLLDITDSTFDDEFFESIYSYLTLESLGISDSIITKLPHVAVKSLTIKNNTQMKNMVASSATTVYCLSCPALETLSAPLATTVSFAKCGSLVSFSCQRASQVDCSSCDLLQFVDAPALTSANFSDCRSLAGKLSFDKVVDIDLTNCPALVELSCPQAIVVSCCGCVSLQAVALPLAEIVLFEVCHVLAGRLSFDKARQVTFVNCPALVELSCPQAITASCRGCSSLRLAVFPMAEEVFFSDCLSLAGKLLFDKAREVTFANCPDLIEFSALRATWVSCSECIKLQTVALPLAEEAVFNRCMALQTITLPAALKVTCTETPSLTSLTIPFAEYVDCKSCTALKSLSLPHAKTVECGGCSSLLNLTLPEATTVDCSFCLALESLILPKATKAKYDNCGALRKLSVNSLQSVQGLAFPLLSEFSALNAKIVSIQGTALTVLDFPLAVKVTCIGCTLLSSLSCAEATSLACNGCINLSDLHAPKLSRLVCPGVPSLKHIQIPEIIEISSDESFPYALLGAGHRAFQEKIALYKMLPGRIMPENEVPSVPPLDIESLAVELTHPLDLESLRKKFLACILNIDMDDSTAAYLDEGGKILNGGQLYSKQELLTGMGQIFECIRNEAGIERLLLKTWQNECVNTHCLSRPLRTSAFIRLAVAALEDGGEDDNVADTFHLLYRLGQLLSFFDALNFDRPREAGYILPARLKGDKGVPMSAEQLKANLVKLFDFVKSRKACLGSPRADDHKGLESYYKMLGRYLQWIAINLENSPWQDRAIHLIDLGVAGGACATRWLADADQIYRLTTPQSQVLTISDLIHIQDGQFKLGVLEEMCIDSEGQIDVHTYQQYKKRLTQNGIYIPGSRSLIEIEDPSTIIHLDATIMPRFLFEYRPVRVLLMFRDFLSSLLTDLKNRDLFLEFLKELRPPEWTGEDFSILNAISELELSGASRQEIRKVLAEKMYYIRPDWNAAAALENYAMKNIQWYPERWEKLKAEVAGLSIEEQKKRLQQEGIPLGQDDPDFSTEIFLNYVNPAFIETLLEKNSNGDPTFTLTWSAMFDILERAGKFEKIDASPNDGSSTL